jgi:hypothetical protein
MSLQERYLGQGSSRVSLSACSCAERAYAGRLPCPVVAGVIERGGMPS